MILELSNEEKDILKELVFDSSKFELAKEISDGQDLEDYIKYWDNLKEKFEDWTLDNDNRYYEYKNIYFYSWDESGTQEWLEKILAKINSIYPFNSLKEFKKIYKSIINTIELEEE